MMASKHIPRIVTGVALIVLLAVMLWLGGMWLHGLAFVFAALALWEFVSLFWHSRVSELDQGAGQGGLAVKLCGTGLCAVLFAATTWGAAIPVALSLCLLMLALTFLVRYGMGNDTCTLRGPALVAMGLLYIPLPLLLALGLTLPEQLLIIALVAAADTGAYCAGNAWGTHRIWPRVSPKKSLEGCVGGLVACMVVALLAAILMGNDAWLASAVFGAVLSIAAMLGDFFESALKRVCQVKDSGTILPGHGGVLDRLDSLLFVVPVYLVMKSVWPLF